MKKLIYILILITSACELVIDVDQPPFQPSIVVGSFIGTDTTITVNLSEDRDVLERPNEFNPITGATVRLFQGNQLLGMLEEVEIPEPMDVNSNELRGRYGLDFRPTAGVEYRLEVEKEGFASVHATDRLPAIAPEFEVVDMELDDLYDSEIDLRILDQPGRDYYEVRVYLSISQVASATFDGNTEEWTINRIARYTRPIDIYTENIAVEEHNVSIFSDRLFDGRSYELSLETYIYIHEQDEPKIDRNPVLTVEVRRVSEAYYNYVNSAALQWWVDGDPFSEPVQAFSNVENGRGIFGSYVSTRQDFPLDVD
ncbi:MAG: DUF4249 domain-containing protein [Cytophagales bacterium]|nr:DUF4249 domain-containing protein [Cytophagales bacterium]